MTARAVFKQADLTRACKAAEAAGLKVARMTISPSTGEIALDFEGAVNSNGRRHLDRLHAA